MPGTKSLWGHLPAKHGGDLAQLCYWARFGAATKYGSVATFAGYWEAWLCPIYVGIGGPVGKISGKKEEWAVDLVIGKGLGEAIFAYPLIILQQNT